MMNFCFSIHVASSLLPVVCLNAIENQINNIYKRYLTHKQCLKCNQLLSLIKIIVFGHDISYIELTLPMLK